MTGPDHGKFSPSQLARIIACPASVQASELHADEKEEPSVYAQRGTDLHEMVAEALMDITQRGFDAPQIKLNKEDAAIVGECLDYVAAVTSSLPPGNWHAMIEESISLAGYGLSEVYGTLDLGIYHPGSGILHVIDWKFGRGVWVSADDNPQLRAYAAGLMTLMNDNHPEYPVKTIHTHIFQPLVDNVSTEELGPLYLSKWVHKTLKSSIIQAKSINPVYSPGEKQCRWCAHKAVCRARMEWINTMHQRAQTLAQIRREQLSYDEISECIASWEAVETALKDYKAYLTRELEAGKVVPGYKLVAGRRTRYWKDEGTAISWLENYTKLDFDDYMETKFKSPAKVEKLEKGLKKNEDFTDLYEMKPGKNTLVKESDPRPAVSVASPFQDLIQCEAKEME
jgi:hypothetical protein